jgi:hypothetical protein
MFRISKAMYAVLIKERNKFSKVFLLFFTVIKKIRYETGTHQNKKIWKEVQKFTFYIQNYSNL